MKRQSFNTNMNAVELAAVFREASGHVFFSFGKDPSKTIIETFHELGQIAVNTTRTGFYSFRNDDLFYWVFLKACHRPDTAHREKLTIEFESQLKSTDGVLFNAVAVSDECGSYLIGKPPVPVGQLNIEFESESSQSVDSFIERIRLKLG